MNQVSCGDVEQSHILVKKYDQTTWCIMKDDKIYPRASQCICLSTSPFQVALVTTFWRAGTAGASSQEEDELLSRASDLSPDRHTSLQPDVAPMELSAAQQPDAQLATEAVESESDASEPSEDFMQSKAVQPLSMNAAKEGSDEEDDGLVVTAAGSSGAELQEAHFDEAPLYPGDTHVQGMLYVARNRASCIPGVLCCLVSYVRIS